MSKIKKIKVDISPDEQIFGSSIYSIIVNITNISSKDINKLEIEPTLIIGKELIINYDMEESELSELESEKNKVIREMENQIEKAYEANKYREMKIKNLLLEVMSQLLDTYTNIFYITKITKNTPRWANEAFKIGDWEDVEKLELEIMSLVKDGSLLKKAFLINKSKLKRIIDKINLQNGIDNSISDKGINLSSGETLSFPFRFKSPHLLKSKSGDIQFKVSYKESDTEKMIYSSIGKRIFFFPSMFAVPTGSIIGSVCGYFIKLGLMSSDGISSISYSDLIGSILLGLVIALLTSRKNETTKVITVEDFAGGFLIGALVGIFNDSFIKKLRIFVN